MVLFERSEYSKNRNFEESKIRGIENSRNRKVDESKIRDIEKMRNQHFRPIDNDYEIFRGGYSPGTIDNDLNARNTRNVLRPETFPISVIIVT